MKRGETYCEFRGPGKGAVVLRALQNDDFPAPIRFANTLVRDKRTNPDLGIVSLDRIVNRKEGRKFLSRVLAGLRTDDVVSVAAFDRKKMVGNCDIYRRKPKDVHHTGVLGIVVVDGFRGHGLGEALLRAALAQAMRIGIWLVEL